MRFASASPTNSSPLEPIERACRQTATGFFLCATTEKYLGNASSHPWDGVSRLVPVLVVALGVTALHALRKVGILSSGGATLKRCRNGSVKTFKAIIAG